MVYTALPAQPKLYGRLSITPKAGYSKSRIEPKEISIFLSMHISRFKISMF